MMLLRLPSSHEIEDPIGRWHHSLVFDFFLITFVSILRNSLNYFTETLEDLEICGECSNRRLLDGNFASKFAKIWRGHCAPDSVSLLLSVTETIEAVIFDNQSTYLHA